MSMPLGSGAKFAGYTVLRILGAGGMGEVYLARHPRLPREDALKVLPVEMSSDDEYRARFTREADLAATLWHPHIVGVHDRGEFEGRLWIAMDYVDGTDAARLQREQYPSGMPAEEVVPILNAVAAALDYAHGRNLLHRDVKPSNILMTDPGRGSRRIMLADFGVARHTNDETGLTTTNTAVGSVAYTAPEQLTSESLDARADQYALAAAAYHLLTGAPPFAHPNPAVVIAKRLSSPPPLMSDTHPHLRGLNSAMARAMAREPAARFGSCSEFADAFALGAVSPDRSTIDPPTAPTAPTAPVVRAQPRPQTKPQPQPQPPSRPTPPPMMVSGWSTGTFQPVNNPMTPRPAPTIRPVGAKSPRSPLPWVLSAVGLAVILVGVVLAITLTGGNSSTVVTSQALTPITPEPADSTTTTTTATAKTTTTARTPTVTATPPILPGPDPRDEDCAAGIQLPGHTGWASRAGRGSAETSCMLARGVLEAYWAANPSPSTDPTTIHATGAVPCNTTAGECAGDKFVMDCAVLGRDGWITCTGGKNARVYLY